MTSGLKSDAPAAELNTQRFLCGLTFDMRGGYRIGAAEWIMDLNATRRQAGGRPLDGRVRRLYGLGDEATVGRDEQIDHMCLILLANAPSELGTGRQAGVCTT
jgi:hypothetical protein